MTMRIAIVNDLAMAREALRRAVAAMPHASVAWLAADGAEAVEKARIDRPDLILMDLIMPGIDGIEATRQIMRQYPCAIVVVTATVKGNASRVYEAISAGALDAVDTPRIGADGSAQALAQKIESVRRMQQGDAPRVAWRPLPARAAGAKEPHSGTRAHAPHPGHHARANAAAPPAHSAATPPAPSAAGPCCGEPSACIGSDAPSAPLVAIGASTGGPQAIAAVLAALPANAPFATLIVQHMEASFLPGFASWLTERTGRTVRLARAGERPAEGSVLLAGEAKQLVVFGRGTLCYTAGPAELVHRPSVDVLFESLAASHVQPGVAVLLTGMGRDGARGLLELRRRGWSTIAQDDATSVVWGMPGAAVELNAAASVLPLHLIGPAVAAAMATHRAPRAEGTR